MLGTVILAFILIWFGLSFVIAGLIYGVVELSALGAICSLIPLPFLILLHLSLIHISEPTRRS